MILWMKGPINPLNMVQDKIGPKMSKTVATEIVIHSPWKAWYSMCIVPIDSSNSQCLFVTVKARQKNWYQELVLEKDDKYYIYMHLIFGIL